jgi:GAF domain-containing protein
MDLLPSAPSALPETADETIRRLTAELREAREQQAATSEILEIINRSPDDLAPVFDAILEKAHSLCGAEHGALATFDGEYFRAVALHAMPEPFGELLRQPFRTSAAGSAQRRLLQGERLIHIPDVTAVEPVTPIQHASIEAGIRTLLVVPLRKDDRLLGYITANRREVRPFSDKQIALLQNFAAQAVIAMENARLLTETREALEQQTATAEVLQVINSSPGDLAPVFDAILDKAHSLCGAEHGSLFTYDGELFWRVATQRPPPAQFSELVRDGFRPGPGNPFVGVLEGERLVHIADIRQGAGEQPDDPGLRVALEVGLRTFLIVPLRKDKVLLGVITAVRREVRPFSDKQIALLENFAAQAVIAMENARLINETREALEQQTATAEVLQVINSSSGDLAPVFDAMLERAIRLCDAVQGALWLIEGEHARITAAQGLAPDFVELLRERGGPTPPLQQIMRGERVIHYLDTKGSGLPFVEEALAADVRTLLWVALVREGTALGAFAIARREVRAFTDKEIALLQNFAAQAVIAMENARLLTETREALEQQTATAEVL